MDIGAVVAQYFGTFLMTASYVAIGLFASSLTRNQMVSLIIGLAIIGTPDPGGSAYRDACAPLEDRRTDPGPESR